MDRSGGEGCGGLMEGKNQKVRGPSSLLHSAELLLMNSGFCHIHVLKGMDAR